MKSLLINIIKLVLAIGLIWYLVFSGKLNFSQLKIYTDDLTILGYAIFQWLVLFVGAGSLRWYLLLVGLNLPVVFRDVVRLQLIGLFFNTVMPGAVGGDLVKGIYVVRGQPGSSKTTAMLSILVDRVVGLMGLFLFAAIVIGMNFEFVWNIIALRPFVFVVFGIGFGTVISFGLVLIPSAQRDHIGQFLDKPVFGFALLKKIYVAMRCYRQHPMTLFYALIISVINQASMLTLFWLVGTAITGQQPSFGAFATVIPICLLIISLPLAPGGLGVGHLAFENMLNLIGVSDGANIFNIVQLGMLALNLFGVFPYLLHRGEIAVKSPIENNTDTEVV